MSGDSILDGGAHDPGLHVTLSVTPVEAARSDDAMAVRVDVVEAARPLRISVYLDGDLVDTWAPAGTGYELHVPAGPGRHVITARAIDSDGRWGGASVMTGADASIAARSPRRAC